MNKSTIPTLDGFSLTESGLLYKLLCRLGMVSASVKGYAIRSLFLSTITWLLAILFL